VDRGAALMGLVGTGGRGGLPMGSDDVALLADPDRCRHDACR